MNPFNVLAIILSLISLLLLLYASLNSGLKERECAEFFNVYKCEWVLKPLLDE